MVVASLLVALSGNVAGAADLDSSSRSPSTHATDDGFTRDSLAELGRAPVSPHPSAPIAATTRLKHSRLDGKDFVAHTDGKDFNPATAHRHPGTTRSREGRLAAQTHKRRNPVQSFIYGWNGWVLRTFHTKFGTVLLSRIGART